VADAALWPFATSWASTAAKLVQHRRRDLAEFGYQVVLPRVRYTRKQREQQRRYDYGRRAFPHDERGSRSAGQETS
jgi:hypothetical protein